MSNTNKKSISNRQVSVECGFLYPT